MKSAMEFKTGKIYSIGFTENLIDVLANYLLTKTSIGELDLSKTALIFPGRRPQFYLRKALAQRFKKSFFPPSAFSIEEFMQFLVEKKLSFIKRPVSFRPGSLIDTCYLIHRIIQDLDLSCLDWQKHLEFEHFFLWARKILQFLEEMDKELVSENQLLNLQDNAQIGLPIPEYANRLLENINQIHARFHEALLKQGITTSGFNYYQAAQSIEDIRLDEFEEIIFCGFFALNACEKKIVKHLLDQKKAILIWQKDEDSWSIFTELEEFFRITPEPISSKPITKPPVNIQIYEGFDTHSQTEAAKRVLSGIPDLENTCVVLTEEGSLMPLLFQALPEEITDYNISLGYPLKRTPIYALINMIIQAQVRRRKDGSFYTKDYLKVLMHPYVKNAADANLISDATRILIHKVEEALLGINNRTESQRRVFVQLKDTEDEDTIFQVAASAVQASGSQTIQPRALRDQLRLLHEHFFTAFDSCVKFSDFVQATQKIIYFILEKSHVARDIFSPQAFNRFLVILEELERSLFKHEIISKKTTFFELLKTALFFEKIPFAGTPVGGLQILGLLETRNLNFKNLIILDVNEGLLPKTGRGESLVPEGIFPVLGLPHYHKKEQIMRYHFRRLVYAAENAHLVYASSSRGKESRSRFIEEIIWQKEQEAKKLHDPEKIEHIEFKVSSKKEPFRVKKTTEALEFLQKNHFSPTSLDTYLNCPAQFYFRYCLGLKEKEDLSEEVQASDIGNFLHSLLRDFYSLFLNKTVKLDSAAHKCLLDLKQQKMKEFFPRATGERFLLEKIIDYKLKLFFKHESARRDKIKILYLEKSLPVEAQAIKIKTKQGDAYLKGKLDRVDERIINGKKRIVILDYKTGGYKLPRKNFGDEPWQTRGQIKKAIGSCQLPLYIYMFSKFAKLSPSKITASFYSLRSVTEEFLFTATDSEDSFGLTLAAIRDIISEILSSDIDFVRDDSDERYCQWCGFGALCKR